MGGGVTSAHPQAPIPAPAPVPAPEPMSLTGLRDAVPFGLPGLACRQARFALPALGFDAALPAIAAGQPPLVVNLPPALAGAVPRRQAEFLAGRLCAALCLRALGAGDLTVPINPDRSPHWPPGFVGSISHSADQVCAVVARQSRYRLLGVDLEPLMPKAQAQDLAATILAPADAAQCPPNLDLAAFVTVIFSAKEAFYKAIYPSLGRVIGFHDVVLHQFGPHDLRLALAATVPPPPAIAPEFLVHYDLGRETCLCLMAQPCTR